MKRYKAIWGIIIFVLMFNMGFVSASTFDNIIAYWNMDSQTAQINSSVLNLISWNAASPPNFITGIVNLASNFSAAGTNGWNTTAYSDSVQLNQSGENFTINFWVYHRSVSGTQSYIWNRKTTGDSGGWWITDSNGQIDARGLNGTIGASYLSNYVLQTNRWYMLTFIKNSTSVCTFINTTLDNCIARGTIAGSLSPRLVFGQEGDGSGSLDGVIDEFGIWNRAISNSEVSDLYNNGNGETYTPGGIYQNSPANGLTTISSPIAFNCTTNSTMQNITLFVNNASNYTQIGYNFYQSITFPVGSYQWFCQGLDSSNNQYNSSIRSFNITYLIENSQNFLTNVLQGNIQNFSVDISIDPSYSIQSAKLWYNNTANPASISGTSQNFNLTVINLITPSVSSIANISFFWEIQLSNLIDINLTARNQTVFSFNLDNCSSNTIRLLNLTLFDQDFQTPLTGNIEYNIDLLTIDRSQKIISFSGSQNSTNLSICLSQNISSGNSYSMDATFRYYAPSYSTQFYNIQAYNLNSSSLQQAIALYDLNSSDSTNFQLTFTGTNFLPENGVIVLVERQYLAENIFKTVEAPLTDTNGQTILHLVKNDIVYNLVFMKNGVIIKSFSNLRAFCDPTIGSCVINLNAISTSANLDYNHALGIVYPNPPIYNSTTGQISFEFSSIDGSTKTVLLEVTRSDIFGNTSICNNSVQTISGAVSCMVPLGTSDTNLKIDIYVNGVIGLETSLPISTSAFGSIGIIAWFLLTLGVVLMFSNDKNGILLALLFSYLGAISLGWIVGGIIGTGTAGISIIIMTVIGLWKLNKNKFGA